MLCPKCGFNNPKDSSFCQACGKNLDNLIPPQKFTESSKKSIDREIEKIGDVLFSPVKKRQTSRNVLIILFITLIYSFFWYRIILLRSPVVPSEQSNIRVISNPVVDATISVIYALGDYYLATQNDISEDPQIVDYMTSLLNQNNHLDSGNSSIDQYLNDPNEVIQITATGMKTGANIVKEANNKLVQYLRKTNIQDPNQAQEIQYAVANYISNQKKGYELIARSAPQITSLLFKPADSKNPTGQIPYTISKEERQRILDLIEQLFGQELKQYEIDVQQGAKTYNMILFSVDAIKNNLIYETYEEAIK